MPGSDTSHFSVTSVGLLLEMSDSPSLNDTGKSFTFGDTEDINDFVLSENVINPDFLFEEPMDKVDLVSNSLSTVDLDFEDVVLLLSEVGEQVVLSMHNGPHCGAVFLYSVQLHLNSLGILGRFSLIVGEGFSLGIDPVLVEPSKSSLVQMVCPDGGKGSKSSWGFNVAD